MITELLLVHHSHTDIGYTHPQPIIFELHSRFIAAALDLADSDSLFKWTCEVTGTTRMWWDQASEPDRSRFVRAIEQGQLEVAAMQWHLTPLADLRMLIHSMENAKFFRSLGIPVRSAMDTDVNGVPWGLVDVLLDHGIDGFSMSSNSHFGHPVTPRPGAFRWASPSGREITVWNGYQYWHAAAVLMRLPLSIEEAGPAVERVTAETEARGYPFSFLPLQITNPHHPDNAGPDATLCDFVRAWNAREPRIKLRTVLLSEVFERLRAVELPLLSGDWTDWWNFGAGSSSRETAAFMEALRTLDAARFEDPSASADRAAENLALYAEHTWGADCSISQPESLETKIQWSMKSAYSYSGLSEARIGMRDAMQGWAREAGGNEPTHLLFNPLPFPVRRTLRLPVRDLDWALNSGVHHLMRLDGALNNLPDSAYEWCEVELPAFGYRTCSIADTPRSSSAGLSSGGHFLKNGLVRIEFLPDGGVGSLEVGGVEFSGSAPEQAFGRPVMERPTGERRTIMHLDFARLEPADGWHPDFQRTTVQGKLTESGHQVVEGAAEFWQAFCMPNGDIVRVTYRLFANDATVDLEVKLTSAGDASPYSLGLPFVLAGEGSPERHFDTAGAIVEFDKEQLPGSCRHYVTARRFVRTEIGDRALTVATPDLPLWKFGNMDFGPRPISKTPSMIAWLSNNYWEVNFLANQSGVTNYRFRLIPHRPEPVEDSYTRALPYSVPPLLHVYRGLGPAKRTEESFLTFQGEHFMVENVSKRPDGGFLVLQNLADSVNRVRIGVPSSKGFTTSLSGEPKQPIPVDGIVELPGRGLVGVSWTV